MNSEFENHLQRQPMREIPQHWRGRILAATQPARPWWEAWLWPSPKAWAALGAAWVVILLLNLTTPDGPRVAGGPYRPTPPAVLLQEQTMMAQLLGPNDNDTSPPAVPYKPKPRSEIDRRRFVG